MGASQPRIGVVVLNWNGRQHLARCLPSLLASEGCDFFVVVVDNGSTDGSAEWVKEQHPEVEVLALRENHRFAGGNNRGAARALERGAAIIVLLNNDTTVEPTALRALSEVFEQHPAVGIAGPRIVYESDPSRIWYGGGFLDLRRGIIRHRALRQPVDRGCDRAGETGWVTGCALAIRAALWERLGGLDESFYIYAEDVDLCLRAREVGTRLQYVPRAIVRHAVSASVGGHFSAFKAYHKTRSRIQLLQRHGVGSWWRISLLLQDLGATLWLGLHGAFAAARAVLEARLDLARGRLGHPVLSTTRRRPVRPCPPKESGS